MSAPPYMRFYVGDYLADTTHLSRSEHGAYMLLLMGMWRAGGKLPANDAKLARIAQCNPKEWEAIRDVILDFFQRKGGSITQKRMVREMSVYADKIERAKRGGKASASQKANKNNEKNTNQLEANFNQPEPEPEPKIEDKSSIKRAAKRTPIPDDWEPRAAEIEFAAKHGFGPEGVEREAVKFKAHHAAAGKTMANWSAAWRTWIMNAEEWRKARTPEPVRKVTGALV